jgi:hypothetical protein
MASLNASFQRAPLGRETMAPKAMPPAVCGNATRHYNLLVAYITNIEDDQNRVLAELISTFHQYQFADGSSMYIQTVPAWCRGCQGFVMAEKLADPSEMESQAREFCAAQENSPLMPPEIFSVEKQREMNRELFATFLREAQQWRAALVLRTSPPRCLECGGTDFTTIPDDKTWVPHPGIPGRQVRAT